MTLSNFVSPVGEVSLQRNSFNQGVARQYFSILNGGANKSRTLSGWAYD